MDCSVLYSVFLIALKYRRSSALPCFFARYLRADRHPASGLLGESSFRPTVLNNLSLVKDVYVRFQLQFRKNFYLSVKDKFTLKR